MNSNILLILAAALLISFGLFAFSESQNHLSQRSQDIKQLYEAWKVQYNKKTSGWEDDYRFGVFRQNYEYILEFNANSDDVKLALNQFADLTKQEWRSSYLGYKKSNLTKNSEAQNAKKEKRPIKDVPQTLDWRTKGVVNPIKNQGQCGSCWAFSAVAGLESLHAIKTGSLLSFSEQQIVDCDTQDDGCDGGDLPTAYQYVISAGIELESTYPYAAVDQSCQYSKSDVVWTITDYDQEKTDDGANTLQVVQSQPVPVCIEADQNAFQFYSSGVISKGCGTNLDHCVEIVGYNLSASTPYWIVRNSWGTSWGNQGYVWIEYKASGAGICGINEEPVIPIA